MTIVDTVIAELAQERASATNEFIRCVNKDLQSALAFLQASSLATSIPNLTLLGNISGVTAAPLPHTLTAFIDACIDNTQGDVLFRSATGWVALSPGTSGQFLETQGAAANPRWAAVPAGSLANIGADTLLANITGSAAPPAASSLTAVLDALLSNVQGDIIFRGATGWAALAPGNAGGVLITGGAAANPAWSGPGQIPGTATNNNAGAGNVGEYFSASVAEGTVNLTSGVTADIATLVDLSPGDWDISGQILFSSDTTTVIQSVSAFIKNGAAAVSSSSALISFGGTGLVAGANSQNFIQTGICRVSIAVPTNVAVTAGCNFTTSFQTAGGFIGARRAR